MPAIRSRATLAFLVLFASACGESHSDVDAGPGGFDASTTPDAGTTNDAGMPAPDAGFDASLSPHDGGPLLPPLPDGGDPWSGVDGGPGAPDWVPIDVLVDGSTCTPLEACGGDVLGTWDVTGGCFEAPIGPALEDCPGATVMGTGRARGRVTFGPVIAQRLAQSEVRIDVGVPALCAAFVGGCSGIETQIRMYFADSACRANAAGDCECAARETFVIDDGDAYTTESNQIVSSSSGRRWDYCIMGDELRYRDVDGDEPGIIELGR